jgi:hypothetical protein
VKSYLIALCLFCSSYASITNAGMVTATYTGTVTSTNTGTVTISKVKVGDTVTGQYVFDDTATDELPLDPVNGRYETSQFSLTVNGFKYSSGDNTIAVLDNGVPGPGLPAVDLYEIVTSLGNTPGPSLSGLPPSQIDLVIVDTDTTVFSDDSLPTSLNIEDFEITNDQPTGTTGGRIFFRSSSTGQTGEIRFEITDISMNTSSEGPVDLAGSVKTKDGMDLCSMVLASGQFMFTCNPVGQFSLNGLPRENNGTVKRQVYVDGFFPKIDVLSGSVDETVVMTRSGTCPSYNSLYDPAVVPDSAGKRIDITGKILLQDIQTPICAMVLANGQFMFSCDGTGSYALNIPLDNNGQFKLQVYADGFAPITQKFDESSAKNDVRMARAVECQ